MQITLEPQDLQAIADLVAQRLDRRLAELLSAAQRPVSPVPPPLPAQQAGETRSTPATGDMLRRGELRQITGLSQSTLWRLEKAGQFPARLRLSRGRVGWRRADVMAWMTARQAA